MAKDRANDSGRKAKVKLEQFSSKDQSSVDKFKDALSAGKVGAIHPGGQWESTK